jgi:hypothetical protein
MRFQADQTSCPGVRGRQVSHRVGRIQWAACDTILGCALVSNFSRARDGPGLVFERAALNFGAEFGRF